MKTVLRYITCLLFLTAMLASCKESSTDVHKVDPEFEEYVQRFFACAEKYGVTIPDKNIVMVSKILSSGKAGLCYMERYPVYIEIDGGYWMALSGAPNEDESKEDLIFHEMGHGFLRRYHDNTELKNGDWKTIMCGDQLPHGRAANINYRGMRRNYYLKELFTQTTEVPAWSTYVPDFSHVTETEIFNAVPSDERYWRIGNTDNYNARIEDGLYIYTNKIDNSQYVPLTTTSGSSSILDVTGDFCLEAQIKFSSTTITEPSGGIGFSNYSTPDGLINPLHYAQASKKKLFYLGESDCHAPFVYLYSELINEEDFNKMTIRKNKDTLFYYINDTFVYHNDLAGLPIKGSSFGLLVGGHCDISVKSVTLKTSGVTKCASDGAPDNAQPVDLGPNFAILKK
ncbi:MAG: hypothetical protein II708_01845 [Paludibacteraceae bacterium]|nr:hypothetical protein [Paludibacteraceae bacterium]